MKNYERLTARNERGDAYYPYCFREDTCGGSGESEKCVKCEFVTEACNRLADFEDIGLEPEQLREVDKLYTEKCEELAKYKKLGEQGMLLPCKISDTVYLKACCECICLSEDIMTGIKECPFERDCEFEECSNGNERMFETSILSIWNNGVGWYFTVRGLDLEIPITDIGRTVFLNEDDVKTKGC